MGFSVKKFVKKTVKVATAPMRVATEVVAKGATYAGAKAGIPGAARADRFMRGQLRETRKDTQTSLAIGAGAGLAAAGAVKLGGAIAGSGVGQVVGAGVTAPPPVQTDEAAGAVVTTTVNDAGAAPLTFLEWLRSLVGGGR